MKSLYFHVCHILPPYGKACPYAFKLLTMCPTMWLPTQGGYTVYKPKLTKILNQLLGTSKYIQLYIQLAITVKKKAVHSPSHRLGQCRGIDCTPVQHKHKQYRLNTLQIRSALSQYSISHL